MNTDPNPLDAALRAALDRRRAAVRPLAPHDSRHAPLTPTQFGLWYAQQRDPRDPTHHRTTLLRVTGPLDLDRLHSAIGSLIERHEPLRTIYPASGDEGAEQLVLDSHDLPFEFIDCEHDPEALDAVIAAADHAPFDPAHAVPFAATVVRLADTHHVVVLAASHLALDGSSETVLIRDLAAAYAGRASAPLPVRFRDWAAWRHAASKSARARRDADWWLHQLLRPITPVSLPPGWTTATALPHATMTLPDAIADGLRAMARADAVTPFSVVLTAVAIAMHEHAGASELVVEVPILGRGGAEVDDLVGCFTQVLPVRLDATPAGQTARDSVRAVSAAMLAAQDHAVAGIADIVAAVRGRTRRATPIDTLVSAQWRRFPHGTAERAGATTFESIARPPAGDGVQIRVDDVAGRIDVHVGGGRVHGRYVDPDPVARALVGALTAIVQYPDAPIGRSASAGSAGTHDVVTTAMQRLARADPDAPAIETAAGVTTRAALDAQIDSFVARLRTLGVRPGDVVAIELAGIPGAVALHGAWRAGAVCLPVEPELPAAYRERLLRLAAPAAVIDSLDGPPDHEPSQADANALSTVASIDPDAPGYIIFTSGSTGEPSGVMLSRRSIAAYLEAAREVYALDADDRIPLVHSLAFDASLIEAFVALTSGATLVEHHGGGFGGSVREMLSAFDRAHVTALTLPTALFHEMTAQILDGTVRLPHRVRLVVIGGQAARADAVGEWQRRFPGVRLVNGYGPTEATVEVTVAELTTSALGDGVPIGSPFGGNVTAVVDDRGAVVEDGREGELWVSGPQLALGYLGDRTRTDARFVIGSGALSGRRWYRTGDRVRHAADGQLVHLGRLDGQLKVRGYRVEPREIEDALATHPGVLEVAVIGGNDMLVAHVLTMRATGERAAPGAIDLARYAASVLPSHLVPNRFALHSALPRTPGGKIDRRALAIAAGSAAGSDIAPRDVGTDTVLATCRAVLGVPDLRDDEDFFTAGGTSLHALRLVAALERELGRAVPLSVLLAHANAADLRAALAADAAAAPPSGVMRLAGAVGDVSLFLLPPGGGELLAYREIARHFDGRRSVYTFELPGLDGSSAPLAHLAEAVDWHVDRIVATQPHGPYLLAGFSLGAFLAVEAARSLHARGEHVALIAMIDPNLREPLRAFRRWRHGDRGRGLADIAALGVQRRWEWLRTKATMPVLERLPSRSPRQSFDLVRYRLGQIFQEWQAAPLALPLTVLRAVGTPTHPRPLPDPDPMLALTPDACVIAVPGHHRGADSLLTGAYAIRVATTLDEAIERSLAAPVGAGDLSVLTRGTRR